MFFVASYLSFVKRSLLERFIAMVVEAQSARVPSQLLEPDDGHEKEDETERVEIDEFSGVGNIAGVTLPLGMSTPGKKKRPGWK